MKYCLFVFQWMVLATAWAGTNKPAPKPQPPPGNRFLFVVETSTSSARLEHGGRQAVFDLIYSGMEGRMRGGDTYGIWTFSETVTAGAYPMQIWQPKEALNQASQAGRFLKTRTYEKEGKLEPVFKQLSAVLRVARDVNVILVTDGTSPVQGTPFDQMINAQFATNAVQVRETKKPLIATLTARNGQFTAAEVTLAGDPITLADLPKPASPDTNTVVLASSNGLTNLAINLPQVSPPQTNSTKPIGKVVALVDLESQASKGQATNTTAKAPEPRPGRVDTNDVASTPGAILISRTSEPTETNSLPTQTNSAPAAETNAVPAVATVPSPSPPPTASPTNIAETPLPEPLPKIVPAQIRVEAREPIPRPVQPPTPQGSLFANIMLVLGGLFVGGGAVATIVWIRKFRHPRQASFISRGMDQR